MPEFKIDDRPEVLLGANAQTVGRIFSRAEAYERYGPAGKVASYEFKPPSHIEVRFIDAAGHGVDAVFRIVETGE